MLKRALAAILGTVGALNGVFMLIDGARWYDTVPGLAHTGPFNPHFVADIGAAYLVAGVALIARAWRSRYWPAAVAGAAFMAAHALIHVADLTLRRSGDPRVDVFLVIIPAALAVWAAFPGKGDV
ncbi:hypothetical protein [Terricaulis silvestris]|uniref:DoxX n=1 Tax=Terricaulis silvestris TaxID=2686094 RepID=A0A6I6MXP5_9CAUL|nr:hypothetical protein [Terricaulis silvestris]QGZ97104.1 hypothetical protein DSM104635_03970 [Terricaulis silvestris]